MDGRHANFKPVGRKFESTTRFRSHTGPLNSFFATGQKKDVAAAEFEQNARPGTGTGAKSFRVFVLGILNG